MFPHITHINDLLPFVTSNPQIRVKPCETTGHTVVCYMVQDEDTFAGEHEHYERECRGLTFDANGRVSSRTMHKFFNIGQREDVEAHNIRWQDVDRIMEKRDGSMITPVMVGTKIKCKTKKSFTTKEAALADEVITNTTGGEAFIKWVLSAGMTPTFEITTPKYPIVVLYKQDELTLLHIRENVTGRYLAEREIMDLEPPFPIVENLKSKFCAPGVPANLVSWDILKKYAEETTGVEGVVIQFRNGDMVKLKTVWYCDLHHAVTFTRWRDVARAVVADKSDDLKGAFALTGREIAPILKVEHEIARKIQIASEAVEQHVANGHLLQRTPKDMALAFKEHEYFGQIMAVFRGKEIDWMAWYDKNHLDNDWTLEVVGEEA
jgi:T4 RnlA family RNA ligase